MNRLITTWLLAATALHAATPAVRPFPGADSVIPVGDGTAYILGYAGAPEASLSGCGTQRLFRLNIRTRAILWAVCLPVYKGFSYLSLDRRTGSAVVAGVPAPAFRPTPGALDFGQQSPARGVGILRILPDGSGTDYAAWVDAESPFPTGIPSVVTALRDGSVMVAIHALTPDTFVVGNSQRSSVWLVRISPDGSRSLYSSYVAGAAGLEQMVELTDGSVAMAGLTFAYRAQGFLANFVPSSGEMRQFALLDGLARPRIAATPGRVSVTGVVASEGVLTVFELDPSQPRVTRLQEISAGGIAESMAVDAAGRFAVGLRFPSAEPRVVTANATQRFSTGGGVLLVTDGRRILHSTPLPWMPATLAAGPEDGEWLAGTTEWTGPLPDAASPPVALASEASPDLLFAVTPSRIQLCTTPGVSPPVLQWDVRNPKVPGRVEVHADTPYGPLIGTGATGAVRLVEWDRTYYLVQDLLSGPFASPRVLATEEVRVTLPVRCGGVFNPKVTVSLPNPLSVCAGRENQAVEVFVFGWVAPDVTVIGPLELRVNSPDGPVFTTGRGSAAGTTGPWVRTGTSFFLTASPRPGVALAANRAYLVPSLDCSKPPARTPVATLRAFRDCGQRTTFTLAFDTASPASLVEIREDSPDGPVAARLTGPYGLVDLVVERARTYHLMQFRDGAWSALASATADPGQACEQGGENR